MKFTIETAALNAALRVSSVAMVGNSSLPILGNIKIEPIGEQVILSTTNLDIYVRQKVAAKVEKEGATTAPFETLSRLVGRMQSSTISITMNGAEMEFRSGEVTASLETLEAKEFPAAVELKGDGVECEAADILTPFTLLEHSMGRDTSRFYLMGICVGPKGEFAATDGRRVAIYQGKELSTESLIIPDVFVRSILKIKPEGEIKVFIGEGYVSLVSQEIEVHAKLIESRPPNWKQSVPGKNGKHLSCGREALIHALQTCAIFADRKAPGLFIEGLGKEVEVSQPGKACALVLGTELEGQPKVRIRLNESFLIDALSVLEGENVRIQVTDEISPIVIEEGKFKEVIMPMRSK